MIAQFSIEMNFDYELVMPREGTFGKRTGPNKWDGLVGDLMVGVSILKAIMPLYTHHCQLVLCMHL